MPGENPVNWSSSDLSDPIRVASPWGQK